MNSVQAMHTENHAVGTAHPSAIDAEQVLHQLCTWVEFAEERLLVTRGGVQGVENLQERSVGWERPIVRHHFPAVGACPASQLLDALCVVRMSGARTRRSVGCRYGPPLWVASLTQCARASTPPRSSTDELTAVQKVWAHGSDTGRRPPSGQNASRQIVQESASPTLSSRSSAAIPQVTCATSRP